MDYILAFVLLGVAAGSYWLGLRHSSAKPDGAAGTTPATDGEPTGPAALAARIRLDPVAPGQMLQNQAFIAGVRLLRESGGSSAELSTLAYVTGENAVLGCMALEVLTERRADAAIGERLLQDE